MAERGRTRIDVDAEDTLRRSEASLRLALEAGEMGSFEWNIQMGEIRWSDNLEAIHGLPAGTFSGTFESFQNLIHAEDRPGVLEKIRCCVETGADYEAEFRSSAHGGDAHWIMGRGKVFADGEGRPLRMMGVCMDITRRKRAEEAIRESERRKDEFLAMLAHELRNPLSPLALAAEVIKMCQPTDESIIWARDVIDRQTAQLTRLVDDLLDVSRITLGKINLNLVVVDLRQIIAQAVESTQPLLTARNHALSIDVSDQPLPIRGDAARLTQIISNLLNNAAKYTHDGGSIVLGARIVGARVVVRVTDNGVGIPAPMLERVFDLFTQLESTRDRSQDGLGIGLALVKRLVEMHAGDIEARSEGPGRGSEMVVRFPLAVEEMVGVTSPTREGGAAVREDEVRPLRILVVDDNVDAAESLSRMLRMQQHEVLVAHDGLTALATAPVMKPDVVLLDIGMPGMNGLEVARRLRELDEGAQALLVAITGFGQTEDRARTAAAGFDHHITKPVDPQVLRGLLQTGKAVDHV
jgi:PAS domain S-box-containing protein